MTDLERFAEMIKEALKWHIGGNLWVETVDKCLEEFKRNKEEYENQSDTNT